MRSSHVFATSSAPSASRSSAATPAAPRAMRLAECWRRSKAITTETLRTQRFLCPLRLCGERDLHPARIVRRRAVDRRDLAAHRANVGAELAAVVDRVEEEAPAQIADARLH